MVTRPVDLARGRQRIAGWLRALAAALAATVLGGTVCAAAHPARPLPDFTAYVSREEAVVVNIKTVGPWSPFPGDGESDDLLLLPEGTGGSARERPRRPMFDQAPTRGQASGIVISDDGYILTSAHVVTGIEAASVVLADGREFSGRVVGLDTRSDVALMKIDATGLATARIGDPNRLVVGDWVAAIGAPFGFDATVTAGIVSARRFFPGGLGVPFIQTDVATNPGSSGGPLFNLEGDVVGMSSMVYTSSGGYMGVSFALPIDVAMDIVGRLRTQGRVVRGQLGARIQGLTLSLARAFGRNDSAGALVTRVDRGSAAERAGLKTGDIVLATDDRQPMTYAELQQAVAATRPGTLLPLAVWRAGALQRVLIDVGALDGGLPPATRTASDRGDRLGLVVVEAPERSGAFFANEPRLEVREAHGAALRAGIGAGDVLVALNDVPVDRLALYQAELARIRDDGYVALLIMRQGRFQYFALGP
jgi:serine protease Do